MAGHGNLADRDGPHVQVVHVDDVITTLLVNVLSELFYVDGGGCTLHQDDNNVLNDRQGRPENDDREKVGAERVSVPHSREKVNDCGRNNNAYTHQHVAEDVQERRVDVNVALAMAVVVAVCSVIVLLSLMTFLVLEQILLDSLILDLVLSLVIIIP